MDQTLFSKGDLVLVKMPEEYSKSLEHLVNQVAEVLSYFDSRFVYLLFPDNVARYWYTDAVELIYTI